MSHRWTVKTKFQAEELCKFIMEHCEDGKTYEIHEPTLTGQQIKAVHAYCDHVARDMNATGIDMQHVLSGAKLSIPPTGKMLYHIMWKPIQTAMLQKVELPSVGKYEVDQIYQVMARHLVEAHDINVRFGR
jgi:hypothetical protein